MCIITNLAYIFEVTLHVLCAIYTIRTFQSRFGIDQSLLKGRQRYTVINPEKKQKTKQNRKRLIFMPWARLSSALLSTIYSYQLRIFIYADVRVHVYGCILKTKWSHSDKYCNYFSFLIWTANSLNYRLKTFWFTSLLSMIVSNNDEMNFCS